MSRGCMSDRLIAFTASGGRNAAILPVFGNQAITIQWIDLQGRPHETGFRDEAAASRFEAYLDEDRLAHHRTII